MLCFGGEMAAKIWQVFHIMESAVVYSDGWGQSRHTLLGVDRGFGSFLY